MLNFHLEIFKTLMLNFAYIYSKRRKLVMFILFQTWQFFYPNKSNSPPIRQNSFIFNFWSLDMSRDHVTLRHKKTSRYAFGEKSFSYRSPSDRYCQSLLSTEHILDPGLKTLELPNMNFYLQETFRNGSLISRL